MTHPIFHGVWRYTTHNCRRFYRYYETAGAPEIVRIGVLALGCGALPGDLPAAPVPPAPPAAPMHMEGWRWPALPVPLVPPRFPPGDRAPQDAGAPWDASGPGFGAIPQARGFDTRSFTGGLGDAGFGFLPAHGRVGMGVRADLHRVVDAAVGGAGTAEARGVPRGLDHENTGMDQFGGGTPRVPDTDSPELDTPVPVPEPSTIALYGLLCLLVGIIKNTGHRKDR